MVSQIFLERQVSLTKPKIKVGDRFITNDNKEHLILTYQNDILYTMDNLFYELVKIGKYYRFDKVSKQLSNQLECLRSDQWDFTIKEFTEEDLLVLKSRTKKFGNLNLFNLDNPIYLYYIDYDDMSMYNLVNKEDIFKNFTLILTKTKSKDIPVYSIVFESCNLDLSKSRYSCVCSNMKDIDMDITDFESRLAITYKSSKIIQQED